MENPSMILKLMEFTLRMTYPREVGDTQEAVHDKTECIVGGAIVEHGLVAALVGQDPDTDKYEALEDTVESPKSASQGE